MRFFFKPFNSIAVLLLLGMSADAAYAQSYLSPGYILGEIRRGMGFYTVPEAPDFVTKGRPDPANLDYFPLKPPPRGFHSEAMTPGRRLEAETPAIVELETARAASQARAASAGAPAAKSSTKPAPAPVEEDPPPMKWNAWDTE